MTNPYPTPPGWYPQEDGSSRYWDGSQWTEHTTEIPYAGPAASGAAAPIEHSATGKAWYTKKRFIIPGAVVALLVAIGAMSGIQGDPQPSAEPAPVATPQDTASKAPAAPEPAATQAPAEEEPPAEEESAAPEVEENTSHTRSQEQAIRSAESYLKFTAFSHGGLVNQLEFEGYSTEDATYAVNHLAPDWKEHAVRSAENYLTVTAFSRTGLIKQLEFEEFSTDDATYAVDAIDADWMEQAAKSAQNYLDLMPFSRSGLIDQLKYEGFTDQQAKHGADAAGL